MPLIDSSGDSKQQCGTYLRTVEDHVTRCCVACTGRSGLMRMEVQDGSGGVGVTISTTDSDNLKVLSLSPGEGAPADASCVPRDAIPPYPLVLPSLPAGRGWRGCCVSDAGVVEAYPLSRRSRRSFTECPHAPILILILILMLMCDPSPTPPPRRTR